MKYSVLVKISKRSVTFWYQTEGKPFAPLQVKGSPEVPLYFWIDQHQLHFGVLARERFFQNDPNAYGNYFEIAKDPARHFILHNSPKRVKQLLYYGIEQCLSHFLQSVLYQSDAIESYRRSFPLKFIFEPDLNGPEQALVASLFTEAGYRTVSLWNYRDMLIASLNLGRQHALLLTGFDQTLYLDLYPAGAETAAERGELPDQGADPRIRILSEMIVDYIDQQEPHLGLNKERESGALLTFAAQVLAAEPGPILFGEAELSDGRLYWFRVNLKTITDRLLYHAGDLVLTTTINDLLQKYQLRSTDVLILLGSSQINTAYFSKRLLKQYPKVIGVSDSDRDTALKFVFDQSGPEQPVKLPTRPPIPEPTRRTVVSPPVPSKPPLPVARKPMQPPPLPPPKKKD